MASVRRKQGSKFWWACISLPDGSRRQFSTGLEDESEAKAAAFAAERAIRKHVEKPHQLRAAFDRLAEEFIPPADKDPGPWLMEWAESKRGEVAANSYKKYATSMREAAEWLAAEKLKAFSMLTVSHLRTLRNVWATKTTPGTANDKIKHLRMALAAAQRAKLIAENPAEELANLTETSTRRRNFSPEEWAALIPTLRGEWLAITWLGLNSGGQRLNDLAMLRRSQIDLVKETARLHAAKTKTLVEVPLMRATLDALLELPSSDDPTAFLFPGIAALAKSSRSNQFRKFLAAVGLAVPVLKRRKKVQVHRRRETQELSFHSLRHTATSWLKAAGVTDGIVRSIVGHKSVAMSKVYTHQDLETTRAALEKLEVFNPA